MTVAERGEILRGERIIEKRDAPHATSQELRIKSNAIRIKETKGFMETMAFVDVFIDYFFFFSLSPYYMYVQSQLTWT